MDLREVAAAYQSVYLKEEVEEETVLLEDLSQDEVDDLVEEIIDEFLEEGFSLEQIEEGFEDYISEESEVLNEAKKQKGFMASQREKLAAQKAARVDKSETSKAAKVVRPSDKIAASAKKAVEKRKDTTGTTSGVGTQGTVRSKGGSVGAEGEKGTALPPGKKGGAMIKRDTKSVSGMETGPKAEVKSGVRKAMTYRGVGGGQKYEVAGAKRVKMSDVVKSAEKKAKASTPENKVKSAAKGAVEKAKASVKSGVKKARNFVGSALGKLADKVKAEGVELDSFDTVVAYLIDEEIVSTFEEATAKMSKLSAETISEIHESQLQLIDEAMMAGPRKDAMKKKEYMAKSGSDRAVAFNIGTRRDVSNSDPTIKSRGGRADKRTGEGDRGMGNAAKRRMKEDIQTAYEAVYGGGKKEEKKDTRMTVTNADKKANTPAYQNYMKGDKRYKAADHMKGDK